MSVRERTRSEHEERLEAEVSRLREQSAKELDDIRTSGREIYERENKALREARTDALQVQSRLFYEKDLVQKMSFLQQCCCSSARRGTYPCQTTQETAF